MSTFAPCSTPPVPAGASFESSPTAPTDKIWRTRSGAASPTSSRACDVQTRRRGGGGEHFAGQTMTENAPGVWRFAHSASRLHDCWFRQQGPSSVLGDRSMVASTAGWAGGADLVVAGASPSATGTGDPSSLTSRSPTERAYQQRALAALSSGARRAPCASRRWSHLRSRALQSDGGKPVVDVVAGRDRIRFGQVAPASVRDGGIHLKLELSRPAAAGSSDLGATQEIHRQH